MLRRRDLFVTLALLGGQVNAFTSLVSGGKGKAALNAQSNGFMLSSIDLAREDLTPMIKSFSTDLVADASSLSSFDPELLPLAGVALAVLAGAAFAVSMSSSSSDPLSSKTAPAAVVEEKVDLSIPYDAAAMLSFRELKGLEEGDNYDEEEFKKFKTAYEEATVANVIVKKMQRDLAAKQAEAELKTKKLTSSL